MTSSKVLIIGSGSRENAIAWKLDKSTSVSNIYLMPGNGGTDNIKKACNIDMPITDFQKISNWCLENSIDLIIVGPEAPLADGIVDHMNNNGLQCFGPSKMAAQIESSKTFAKTFFDRNDIPTAKWKSFTDPDDAIYFIKQCEYDGLVVKASGLAAGKGVIVAATKEEAIEAVQEIMELKKYGNAGSTIIIEEKLEGEEISVMAFCDGTNFHCFPPAQDFKRAYDNNKGPNTGGMGAYSPVSHISQVALDFIDKHVIEQTLSAMRSEGYPFCGVLYAGLMITKEGPKVLEFNCRLGDPETQVILPLLTSDMYELCMSCCRGDLDQYQPTFDSTTHVVTVTLASRGYPGSYKKKVVIEGVEDVMAQPNIIVFHAGTTRQGSQLLTNGGRVLSITGVGPTLSEARCNAYTAVSKIKFTGMMYRQDIALNASCTRNGTSYLDAGVDIEAGAALVEYIKPLAKSTQRSGCLGSLGGFGSLFDIKALGYNDPLLVSGTDGVGTKLKIAHACNDHSTIGIDLVAMCVNDILAQGAEPLFFLDYYACGKLELTSAQNIIKGIAEGCKQAGCALVGGETAEMPGMYKDKDYDLAGFAVGVVERDNLLPKLDTIKPGDVVIGLESSGLHSNGFSLVRKIVMDAGLDYSDPCPFGNIKQTIGEVLLAPTKIYVKSVIPLMKDGLIKGFAHITGGGLVDNIPRILPSNLLCTLYGHSWKLPPVFGWLAEQGDINADEMLKVFNCGIGAVLIVSEEMSETLLRRLISVGEKPLTIGTLSQLPKGETKQVHVKGFLNSLKLSCKQVGNPSPAKRLRKDRMKVGILISGSGTNLQALIDHCKKRTSSADIVLVVSNKQDAYGLQRASQAGIPTKVINHKDYGSRVEFDMAVLSELQAYQIELVCLAGFMRILSGEFVRKWEGRLINIHPSLLPSFKGANAHQQVLEAGVRLTGCTAHFVVEEVDGGAIIAQEAVPVLPTDTEKTLQERVKLKEWEVFPKAMELIASRKLQVVDGKAVFT